MVNFPLAPIFIPAHHLDWTDKAIKAGTDGLIYDLEDSVPHAKKSISRQELLKFLKITKFEIPIFIRINSLDTNLGKEDYLAFKECSHKDLHFIIPKIEKIEILREIEREVKLIALIETPIAIQNLSKISEDPRIKGLLLGPADLSNSLGSSLGWNSLLFSRSKLIIESAINNIHPIDGPFMNLSSETGLIEECRLSKDLGFRSKVAIHPSQIQVIKDVFFPSEEELLEAQLIIKAFNESQEGVISFGGKMIDRPLVDAKEKILLMAGLNPKDFR